MGKRACYYISGTLRCRRNHGSTRWNFQPVDPHRNQRPVREVKFRTGLIGVVLQEQQGLCQILGRAARNLGAADYPRFQPRPTSSELVAQEPNPEAHPCSPGPIHAGFPKHPDWHSSGCLRDQHAYARRRSPTLSSAASY